MSKVSHAQARQMLHAVCERYISHKKSQLERVRATSPYFPDFFYDVLDRHKPKPGFSDWIRCKYFQILWGTLLMPRGIKGLVHERFDMGCYRNDPYVKDYPYGQSRPFDKVQDTLDQYDPQKVLFNLKALIGLLDDLIRHSHSGFEALKKEKGFEDINQIDKSVPVSLQVEQTFKKFTEFAKFISEIPNYQDNLGLDVVRMGLRDMDLVFESYYKLLAVQELKAILDNPDYSDKEAISRAESHIKQEGVGNLLERNLQSKSEQRLKLLSIISMFIGVGIFTTLGLVMKRLYDTGGSSINFFKPLSKDLAEDVTAIVGYIPKKP